MEIVVLGAGSLGSLLGGLLSREHGVTLVGREPHVGAVRADGLQISGAIEATVYPNAGTTPPPAADLAIVCVKSFDTGSAADSLSACDLEACLSVQNGLDNESVLADRLGATVLAGTCTYGAVHDEPGMVRCTGMGEVAIGLRDGGTSTAAKRVGEAFESAGISTAVVTDMPERIWQKLAVNAGINATTALARLENGAVLGSEAGVVASMAAKETAAVARSEGVSLSETSAERALERVAEATADNTSSMFQDVRAGRRTEIDAINGYVEKRAAVNDVDAPVNETLARLVRAWERECGVR